MAGQITSTGGFPTDIPRVVESAESTLLVEFERVVCRRRRTIVLSRNGLGVCCRNSCSRRIKEGRSGYRFVEDVRPDDQVFVEANYVPLELG